MAKHFIPFSSTQDGDRELIDLAFSKKKAIPVRSGCGSSGCMCPRDLSRCCPCARRSAYRSILLQPGTYLNQDTDEISYSDFINKEAILFSMADNVYSIPSVPDGLKPGQRKVIWACFKRKLENEINTDRQISTTSQLP